MSATLVTKQNLPYPVFLCSPSIISRQLTLQIPPKPPLRSPSLVEMREMDRNWILSNANVLAFAATGVGEGSAITNDRGLGSSAISIMHGLRQSDIMPRGRGGRGHPKSRPTATALLETRHRTQGPRREIPRTPCRDGSYWVRSRSARKENISLDFSGSLL